MLSSKANAALARLKEIEEKYKIKSKEKLKEDTDSSISSVSIVPLDSSSKESKESPRKVTKLDIKMPDTQFEGHAEEVKLSSRNEKSTPNKTSAKPLEETAEVNLNVAMPLDDKSSLSAGKQESLISNSMTIQENSLIESVLDDSVIPSKLLSKTLRQNSSTASDRSSGRLETTRMTARSEVGKKFGKSSEISKGKASSDNSIAKQLRLSGKSNETSKVRLGQKRFIEVKMATETLKKADSNIQDDLNDSKSLRDDSVVEESIDTIENGSEIISELSHIEKSFVTKIEDSVDGFDGSKYLTDENAFKTVSNSSKGLVENGYANDTFEDISSSTIRSQRKEMINEKKEIVNRAGSKAKKMDIAEYRSYQDSAEEHRLNLTLKSSATKVVPELSNYISDFQNIIGSPDNTTVRSMKLSRSISSRSKNLRKRYQHRKESFPNENDSCGDATGLTNLSTVSSNKKTSNLLDSSTDDVMKTDEKKNSPGITVRQESRKEHEEASNRAKERAVIDVIGLPVANDKDWLELAQSNSSLEKNMETREDISEKNLNQRISQDKYVLKKSHKNALAKKHTSSKIATKALESSFDNKSVSQVQNVSKTRKVREENENCHSLEKHKASNHNSEHNFKRRKKRARTANLKATGTRNGTGSHKEDKALKFDGKQMRGLRKRIVELRLQQEREDLQKYLHELKDLKLESDSAQNYFRPLEFPQIVEFTPPDINDLESNPDDRFRERVFAIRRWLKDQYILYRDYCTMAQAINAHYVPSTLDDAKKTIRSCGKQ